MIRLKIELEIRHDEVMRVCVTEDKTADVVVASYRSVSRNPVCFKVMQCSVNISVAQMGVLAPAVHGVQLENVA